MTRNPTTNEAGVGRKLKVGAWCRSAALEQHLRAEESADVALTTAVCADGAIGSDAAWADDCDVLIIDVDLAQIDELAGLSRIVEMRGPRRPVVATAGDGAIDDVRRLMRLGISDFLPQPIVGADLQQSLRSIARRLALEDSPAKRGAVVTFMRAAGGAGATTLATQLALTLATRGAQHRIALLDLDLQRGTAGLHLNIKSDVGVLSCLERYPEIEPGLVESVANKHESGIDVFAAKANHWPLDGTSPEAVAQLLDVMRRTYDWIVVDTPPIWTHWHRALLERTDLGVAVTQKTVASLRLTRSLIDALHGELRADQVLIACNRVRNGWFSRGIGKADADLALGRPIDVNVPSDYALVSEAADIGVPVSHLKRGSKFEKASIALAAEIERRLAKRFNHAPVASGSFSERSPATREEWTQDARAAV